MIKHWIIIALISISASINAQVGVSGFYTAMNAPGWDLPENVNDQSFFFNGTLVSVDYWFRLKEKRIEFLPTVSYRSVKNDYTFNSFSFHFNTNFYLLDLIDDCDCPTFTKRDPIIKKGFFLQVSPGVNWTKATSYSLTDPEVENQDNLSYFDVGIGAGLDIGVSNLITITPVARYRFGISGNWDRAPELDDRNTADSRLSWFEFGLRVGIRFDARRY